MYPAHYTNSSMATRAPMGGVSRAPILPSFTMLGEKKAVRKLRCIFFTLLVLMIACVPFSAYSVMQGHMQHGLIEFIKRGVKENFDLEKWVTIVCISHAVYDVLKLIYALYAVIQSKYGGVVFWGVLCATNVITGCTLNLVQLAYGSPGPGLSRFENICAGVRWFEWFLNVIVVIVISFLYFEVEKMASESNIIANHRTITDVRFGLSPGNKPLLYKYSPRRVGRDSPKEPRRIGSKKSKKSKSGYSTADSHSNDETATLLSSGSSSPSSSRGDVRDVIDIV